MAGEAQTVIRAAKSLLAAIDAPPTEGWETRYASAEANLRASLKSYEKAARRAAEATTLQHSRFMGGT